MANKTKQQERDRRAKIEAMRKAEQAKERRKSMMFIAIAVVVGLGLIAAAAVPAYLESRNDPANKALSTFGVSKAAADCDAVQTSKGTNNEEDRNHVEDGTTEDYATVPPSYGPHWAAPVFPAREFYTARDRPEMEQLVHNLEHGYTILWYDNTIKGNQLAAAEGHRRERPQRRRHRADRQVHRVGLGRHLRRLPDGQAHRAVALGRGRQLTQVCGKVSGDAVADFIDKHPASDSPEPNAA